MPNENKQRALFIGLGGSGVKTVLKTRQRLLARTEGADEPTRRKAFQNLYRFVLIDTDKLSRSMDDAGVDRHEEEELRLDHVDLGAVVPIQVYAAARSAEARTPKQKRLLEFVGTTLTRDLRQSSLRDGAGAYRVNSRIGLAENHDRTSDVIKSAIEALTSEGNTVGIKPGTALNVWVVSSLAGGTGSGILLDVLYLADRILRSKGQAAPKIRAVLFTPGSFTNFHTPEVIMSNGYSAMQEISCFLANSKDNLFKLVSVVPDDPNWAGEVFSYWPVYHSAIPVDSTVHGGGDMSDKALFENTAEMLTYLQLSSAEGAAASPLDNCLQTASATDRLTAFGYVALRKPVHLFERYLLARRRVEVLGALLGREFKESESSLMTNEWIERVVESITGRLLTRQGKGAEATIAGLIGNNLSPSSLSQELMDEMASRDEEELRTQEGADTGINLRRSIKERFEDLRGGSSGAVRSLESELAEEFNNSFFDDKDRFIKKGASENAAAFLSDVFKKLERATLDCISDFRNVQMPQSGQFYQRQITESMRRAVNRAICKHGVTFASGLVQHCDNQLDELRIAKLSTLIQNLQSLRLALQTEIQAMEVKTADDAVELASKVKILVGLVKELTVAECQSELIAWLCEGDYNGWLDREVKTGLADLQGEVVKAREMAKSAYENELPKMFRASAADVTTQYLPNPVEMLGERGWKQDRDNAFSRYYSSLFAGSANSPESLLSKIGSGLFLRTAGVGAELFASFLPENRGGDSRRAAAIVSVLEDEIAASTELTLRSSTDSEARRFLDKPLAEVFHDFPERQTALKRTFGETDKLFFPLAQGRKGGGMRIAIYAGNNRDFARELGCKATDPWVQDSDPNVLLKLYFEGAFSFPDYFHYRSAEGSYGAVLQRIVDEGREGHQPHIHRMFVNGAPIGRNVAQAIETMTPTSVDFAKGIATPYDDFDRIFATCWLYSELPNHLPPETLDLVFEQALVVSESCYSPFSLRKSRAVQSAAWVESADAIQNHGEKIKIQKERLKKRVSHFRGSVFEAYEAMMKDEAFITALLRDFELKLKRTAHRARLIDGLAAATQAMLGQLAECEKDPRTSGRWSREIATAKANLTTDRGVVPHVEINVLGGGG